MKRLTAIIIVLLSCLATYAQAQNQTAPSITTPAATSARTAKKPFGPFMFKAEGKIVILRINKGSGKVTLPSSEGKIKVQANMKEDGTFVVKLVFPRKTVEIFGDYNLRDSYIETFYSSPQARQALDEMGKNLTPESVMETIRTSKEVQALEESYQGAIIEQEINGKITMVIVGDKEKLLATLTIVDNEKLGQLK